MASSVGGQIDPSAPEPKSSERRLYNALDALKNEVADAKRLLDFAVANAKLVTDALIGGIKKAEPWLEWQGAVLPPDPERTAFEQAYRDLALALAPVTAATLKATSDDPSDGVRPFPWGALNARLSIAKLWSRKLWTITVITAVFILLSENVTRVLGEFFPADQETVAAGLKWQIAAIVLQSLEPFAYGALGALANLLRSAHTFIYERTFNKLRIPEYYNRLLLGMISGGAIKLFITGTPDEEGAVVELSAAALAFIAGYNNDFLFSAIERISAAILPKVGVETVKRSGPDVSTSLTVQRLLDRFDKATDDEKKVIEKLLDRLIR
jgi:hypothetical protein